MNLRNPHAPPNPLDRANIFSLDAMQVDLSPVGCRNPYARYCSKEPIQLVAPVTAVAPGAFVEVLRFPVLGFRHLDMQFSVAYPALAVPATAQAEFQLYAVKDTAAPKLIEQGVISPPYDQADVETEVNAKTISMYCRVLGNGGVLLLTFSVLVEP